VRSEVDVHQSGLQPFSSGSPRRPLPPGSLPGPRLDRIGAANGGDIEPLIGWYLTHPPQGSAGRGEAVRAARRRRGTNGQRPELRNCLERAIILSDDGVIDEKGLRLGPEPVFLETAKDETLAQARDRAADAAEKIWIVRALRRCNGDRSAAAEAAGLTPRRFEAKLKEHGLEEA
jgi:hypothetical protein